MARPKQQILHPYVPVLPNLVFIVGANIVLESSPRWLLLRAVPSARPRVPRLRQIRQSQNQMALWDTTCRTEALSSVSSALSLAHSFSRTWDFGTFSCWTIHTPRDSGFRFLDSLLTF